MEMISALLIISALFCLFCLLIQLWHIRSRQRPKAKNEDYDEKAIEQALIEHELAIHIPDFPPEKLTPAIVECCESMERDISRSYGFPSLHLKQSIVSYVYSFFIILTIEYHPSIRRSYLLAMFSGLMDYCRSFYDNESDAKAAIHDAVQVSEIYRAVACHEIPRRGTYHDSGKLARMDSSEMWKILVPSSPLSLCNPGLMPYVFMDLLCVPALHQSYQNAPQFKHTITRARTAPTDADTSPELGLYTSCTLPIMICVREGIVNDYLRALDNMTSNRF